MKMDSYKHREWLKAKRKLGYRVFTALVEPSVYELLQQAKLQAKLNLLQQNNNNNHRNNTR